MKCPECQTENDPGVDACFTCGRSFGTLTRGSVIASRYEIVRLLGKGGMGTVYEAQDRMLDEAVAIKVLRLDFGSGEEMAQRFRSEIKLARKVSHPNVCRIHDYGETGEVTYISMALLEGTDLGQVLREHAHGLPPREAFDVAVQTAEGLGAIHDAGIIHRDLKTSNIMRDSHGKVRVMDFGIATDFKHGKRRGLTATGEVLGTVEYISPEQCQGLAFDFRSDVYALGVMIFEIFTGEVPFRGNTQVATLFKHIQEPPPFDGPLGSRLPETLVPVLRRALAKSPDDRPATAAELAKALREARRRFLADLKRGLPAAEPPPRRCLQRKLPK